MTTDDHVTEYLDQAKRAVALNKEWLTRYLQEIGCVEDHIKRIHEQVDEITRWSIDQERWASLIQKGENNGT